jgi:hypothetical protein
MVAVIQPEDAERPVRAEYTNFLEAAKRGLRNPSAHENRHDAGCMKPIISDKTWVERGSCHTDKLLSSPGETISCFTLIVGLLVGAGLFFGGIVSFVFLLLAVGLFCAMVFCR